HSSCSPSAGPPDGTRGRTGEDSSDGTTILGSRPLTVTLASCSGPGVRMTGSPDVEPEAEASSTSDPSTTSDRSGNQSAPWTAASGGLVTVPSSPPGADARW